jgi:hypothetical protein
VSDGVGRVAGSGDDDCRFPNFTRGHVEERARRKAPMDMRYVFKFSANDQVLNQGADKS